MFNKLGILVLLLAFSLPLLAQPSVLERLKALEEENFKLKEENLKLRQQNLELQTKQIEDLEKRILEQRITTTQINQLTEQLIRLENRVKQQEEDCRQARLLKKPIMWSGGSTNHGRGSSAGSWHKYATNATEFYTAQDYFTVSQDGTFTVLKDGYYRINMWAISHVTSWAHLRIIHNGSGIHYGHENAQNSWTDNFADLTWRFRKGDTFWVEFHNSGGEQYAYHAWNATGGHSRLQVSYVGELD